MEAAALNSDMIRTFLRAQIIFNNGSTTVECLVKSMSATNAKIAISDSISLPNEFDLCIPQKNKAYRARMTWQDDGLIGVEFAPARPASQHIVVQTPEIVSARLRKLEIEHAELKARISGLRRRLELLGQDPDFLDF